MSEVRETDEVLYRRFLSKRRDDDFRVLFLRHKKALILFLYGIVRNYEDAEELMIDAFAEVAAGSSLFSGRSSFKTWLFSIGKKKAFLFLRKSNRMTAGQEDFRLEDESALSPETELLTDERNRQLYAALSQLHGDYRQVLILLYFEQMSVDQVARVMKKSKKQIYHLAQRGRDALKVQLEKAGFEIEL